MTKSNTSQTQEEQATAPAVDLKSLLAEQAASEEAVKAAAAEAAAKAEAAKAAIDEALSGRRAERDKLLEGINKAKEAYDKKVAGIREELVALESKVEEEFGVPAALFNSDIAAKMSPAKGGSKQGGNGGSRIRMQEIGPVGPVVVTAPYRANRTEEMKFVSIQYVVVENDSQLGPELRAVKVDSETPKDLALENYTHSSYIEQGGFPHNRPSAATTTPGWHDTDDVLYALAVQAGKTPSKQPSSDLSLIKVNGEPLAAGTTSTEAEPITETV